MPIPTKSRIMNAELKIKKRSEVFVQRRKGRSQTIFIYEMSALRSRGDIGRPLSGDREWSARVNFHDDVTGYGYALVLRGRWNIIKSSQRSRSGCCSGHLVSSDL